MYNYICQQTYRAKVLLFGRTLLGPHSDRNSKCIVNGGHILAKHRLFITNSFFFLTQPQEQTKLHLGKWNIPDKASQTGFIRLDSLIPKLDTIHGPDIISTRSCKHWGNRSVNTTALKKLNIKWDIFIRYRKVIKWTKNGNETTEKVCFYRKITKEHWQQKN